MKYTKNMKLHGIWTMLMFVSWIMCIYTGHKMVKENHRRGNE